MNLTTIAIAGLILLGVAAGSYVKGREDGRAIQEADQSKITDALRKSSDEMQATAASAIAGITVKQITIKGRVEHETSTVPVYLDCHHSPDGLRAVQDALTNSVTSQPTGGGQLPASAASR